MKKSILQDEEYFHNYGDALSISDIIEALQYIKGTHGNINICVFGDGIFKEVDFIRIITTADKSNKCAVLEP